MNLKSEKGVTIVTLIIMVILMLILVRVGVDFGTEAIKQAQLEDIKTDMISIKTKAKIVAEQYNYKEIENLVGTPITQDEANKIKVNISSNGDEFRKWSSNDLSLQGLSVIEGDVYVVYYDLDNPNNCEIYSLNGYNGKYSLTDLQDM